MASRGTASGSKYGDISTESAKTCSKAPYPSGKGVGCRPAKDGSTPPGASNRSTLARTFKTRSSMTGRTCPARLPGQAGTPLDSVTYGSRCTAFSRKASCRLSTPFVNRRSPVDRVTPSARRMRARCAWRRTTKRRRIAITGRIGSVRARLRLCSG